MIHKIKSVVVALYLFRRFVFLGEIPETAIVTTMTLTTCATLLTETKAFTVLLLTCGFLAVASALTAFSCVIFM